MINKFVPVADDLAPLVAQVRAVLTEKGETDVIGAVIRNMQKNADMQAKHGIDSWLSYGAYLPAVERVISSHAGEEEADFYVRTGYPVNVVDAYTVPGDDLATLVAADQYSQFHKPLVLKNTGEWCLNEEDQFFINLYEYENRLKAI